MPKVIAKVETPQPCMLGGAESQPFTAHHNTLDMTLYLRITNELLI